MSAAEEEQFDGEGAEGGYEEEIPIEAEQSLKVGSRLLCCAPTTNRSRRRLIDFLRDQELEAMKKKLQEMEAEAAMLKSLQVA